jgi:hypothetical protein
MTARQKDADPTYNEKRQDGQSRFKKGNPGKPLGTKNKLSFQAAERMEELGLDPLQAYVSLLEKARETGNLAVEERCLSRLMQFRWAGLHHSMVTNVDEADLEISVTKFEAPSEWGKGGIESDGSSSSDADAPDPHLGVNVRSFKGRDA